MNEAQIAYIQDVLGVKEILLEKSAFEPGVLENNIQITSYANQEVCASQASQQSHINSLYKVTFAKNSSQLVVVINHELNQEELVLLQKMFQAIHLSFDDVHLYEFFQKPVESIYEEFISASNGKHFFMMFDQKEDAMAIQSGLQELNSDKKQMICSYSPRLLLENANFKKEAWAHLKKLRQVLNVK